MKIKISNYDNLEQKFHLLVFPTDIQLYKRDQAPFLKAAEQEHTLGAHPADSPRPGSHPEESPEPGGPSWARGGGGAPRTRLCGAGDGGRGTRREHPAQQGSGCQTLAPGLSTVHTRQQRLRLPTPSRVPRPSASAPRRHQRPPSIPAVAKESPRSLGGGYPPDRAPPRTGPTKPNSSSHWKRRAPKREPAPDPISAASAGSSQDAVASASARSITSQPCRGPRAGRDARARGEHALGTDATRRSELAPDIALAALT